MKSYLTVSAGYFLGLLKELERQGISHAELLFACNLHPRLVATPSNRLPLSQYLELWRHAIKLCHDDHLPLRAAKRTRPVAYRELGQLLLASGTIREALTFLERYSQLVSEFERFGFEEKANGDALFRIEPWACEEAHVQRATEYGVFQLVSFFKGTLCAPIPINRVKLSHRPFIAIEDYEEFFGAPVEFEADENVLILEHTALGSAIPTANSQLQLAMKIIVNQSLAEANRHIEVIQDVRSALIQLLPKGKWTMEDTAAQLGIPSWTLKRKLQGSNVTLKGILNDVRIELAASYLRDRDVSLQKASELLGFSDQSAFSRAFKGWFKISPTQYQELPRE